MEVTRAGEALLRHATLLPFLSPAFSHTTPTLRAATAMSRHISTQRLVAHGSRSFSTTYRRREEQQKEKPREAPTTADNKKESATSSIASLLDSHLDLAKSSSQASRSRPAFRPATRPSRNGLSSHVPQTSDSIDDLFSAMAPPQRSPSLYSKQEQSEISKIMDLGGAFGPLKPAGPPAPFVDKPFDLKLNRMIGRTVNVDPRRGMDVGRAFRELDVHLRRNKVKQDFMDQRFHERPGLKRKRLKRVRWRRRFKEGFKAIVARVHQMKKQGW